MAYGLKKELSMIIRQLEAQGWSVSHTASGHWKAMPPGGKGVIFLSSTPSDPRSLKNMKAQLRRGGAKLK
jgi:hypothetical protein